jgi:MFS transporter, AAHS family, vanillate permease
MDIVSKDPATELEKKLSQAVWTPRHLVILLICISINFIDGADISIMAYVAPVLSEQWSINYGVLGILFAAVLTGMMLGSIGISPLADTIGRRVIVLAGILVINVTTISIAYIDSVVALVVLRFFTGLGLGAVTASLSPLLAEYMPAKWRMICVNSMAISLPGGAVVGALYSNWIIHNYGWPEVFLFSGVVGILIFLMAFSLLPESIHILSKYGNERALEKINVILKSLKISVIENLPVVSKRNNKHLYSTIPMLFRDGNRTKTIVLCLTFTLSYATVYFLKSWMPKLLSDAGMALSYSINVGAVMSLGGILGGLTLGLLAIYFRISRLIVIFLFVGSFFMICTAFNSNMQWLFMLVALTGFFVFGGFVSLYTLTVSIYPPNIRSTALGLSNGFGRTGAIAGMFIPGIFASGDNSLSHNMLFFSIPIALSAILVLYMHILEVRSARP